MTDSRIRLLLLDFDGTLADTRRANTLAYVETLREAGYALTEEEYAARYFGMRCEEFLTRIGVADPAERERLRLRKIALYPRYFDTVRLQPAAMGILPAVPRAREPRVDRLDGQPRQHRERHASSGHRRSRRRIGRSAPGPGGRSTFRRGRRTQQAPPRLFPGGHAPRRMLAARNAYLRGFGHRHRGRPPQRSGLCRRQTLNSSQMPNDPAGIADSHDTGRNRMRNDAACTDRRAIPDGHARKDHTPSADPHVVADDYGSRG